VRRSKNKELAKEAKQEARFQSMSSGIDVLASSVYHIRKDSEKLHECIQEMREENARQREELEELKKMSKKSSWFGS